MPVRRRGGRCESSCNRMKGRFETSISATTNGRGMPYWYSPVYGAELLPPPPPPPQSPRSPLPGQPASHGAAAYAERQFASAVWAVPPAPAAAYQRLR